MDLNQILVKTGIFEDKASKKPKPGGPQSQAPPPVSSPPPQYVGGQAGTQHYVAVTPIAASQPPDPKYLNGLAEFMRTVSSERYLAFLRQIEALSKIIKDERQLFQAAVVAVDGLTFGEIMHEITDCETTLEEQRSAFEGGIQSKITNAVSTQETAMLKIDAEIQNLKTRIMQLETERSNMARQVEDTRGKAETERGGFGAAYAHHTANLRDLKSKVQLYISAEGGHAS